jgi:pimeloyl-ACP methyl ester carboxylesterase
MGRNPGAGILSTVIRLGVLSLILADTYAGWKGSLPPLAVEDRLATCWQDASLSSGEFVAKYLPSMFSDSATQSVKEELAKVMADFHPMGFRLMAISSARADTRKYFRPIKVATLLIWGGADKRSPLNRSKSVSRENSRS